MCQSDLRAARRLEQLSLSWKEVDPPANLLTRVQAKFRPEAPRRAWLLAAAAAALVGFVIGRGQLRPPQNDPQLGLSTPGPAPLRSIPSGIEEQPPAQPLQAKQIWTTNADPSVVAFSGQLLNLSPHSRLEVVSQQGNHYHLRLSQGQVRIQEHGEVISLETPHLRVDPLGTDYEVRLGPQSSRVYLYSGQVRVTGPNSQLLLTSPGQSAQFPPPKVHPTQPPALTLAPPAPIPGPTYPQRTPSPHSQQPAAPDWLSPQPQPQSWDPRLQPYRRHGGPWEHPRPDQGIFRNTSAPVGKLRPKIHRRPE